MKRYLPAAAAALGLALLGACDFVRFPGDGGPPPQTPGAEADDPSGPDTPPVDDPVPETDGPDVPTDDVPPGEVPGNEIGTPETPAEQPADTAVPGDAETPPADPPIETPPEDTDPGPVTPLEPQPEPELPLEPVFSYYAPGALLPGTGNGQTDQIVHAPGILFPIKSAPAYLQSQVFTFGGGVAGGDQCDARNYAYPWRDNFCETRTSNRNSPFCPTPKIHQGQDIRVGTAADCNTLRRQPVADRGLHEVIAVEDGVISSIGTYTVKLRSAGSIYNYMHLNMNRLAVTAGQNVKAGDLIGYVSNDFGGTATTLHLHFEIMQNTGGSSWSHVPPYMSLVAAYERREAGPGEMLEPNVAVASSDVWVIPEGMEIIE